MEKNADYLLVAEDGKSLQGLCDALKAEDSRIDLVGSVQDAQEAFFRSGGHRFLIIGPDVSPGLAMQISHSLRRVDPNISILVFGPDLLRQEKKEGLTRIPSFHPCSRAGIGAVLKATRASE